jgi:hypothetical protein
MEKRTVTVVAKSSKAKNLLANTMEGNPVCVVERESNSELFLASVNRQHFFWVFPPGATNRYGELGDRNWEVTENSKP